VDVLEIKLFSLEDTNEFGIKLGKNLRAGDILCLNGRFRSRERLL
jgi:tRNA A37 threonylcarbamoyladenosine biosynthesis protein TsaE